MGRGEGHSGAMELWQWIPEGFRGTALPQCLLLAVQQRHSPGTALLPWPPPLALLGHRGTSAFVWSSVSHGQEGWAAATDWELETGSCLGLDMTLFVFYLLPYVSQDCQQHWEPLTWSARISFDTKILSREIILYFNSKPPTFMAFPMACLIFWDILL